MFLATTTYYLYKQAPALSSLLEELRQWFTRYEEITTAAAQKLPYL